MPSDGIPKLTVLYEVIVARLWRRDILRLRKCDPLTGSVITKDILDGVGDFSRLRSLISMEMLFLEVLAMNLTVRNKIEFGDNDIIDTIRKMDDHAMPLPISLEYNLRNLSFLHSDGYGGYSFIHLTFQEYFAASWLLLHVSSLDVYMAEFKYHPRFERIWQFVAGFLRTEEMLLSGYFEFIESEPRDLLGPAHQQLLMCCFNEVRQSMLPRIRNKVAHRLARWLYFECNISIYSFLRNSPEYPDEVMYIFMKNSASICARQLLNCSGCIFLSPNILEYLIRRVNSECSVAHVFALGVLCTQRQLSPASSHLLVTRICKRDDSPGYRNNFTLRQLSDSSLAIAKSLLGIFSYAREMSQNIAIYRLFRLCKALDIHEHGFLEATLSGCMALLKDRNEAITVRIAAADMLREGKNLSDETVKSLAEMLRDSNTSVRESVARAMGSQSSLPVDTIEIIITILKDDDEDARQAAALVFSNYSELSGLDIEALAALVRDSNASIQNTAAVALGGQQNISDDAIAALISLHKHHNKEIRASCATALGKYLERVQKDLLRPSGAVEAALMILLEDPVDFVQMEAASALSRYSSLSQKTTAVLMSRLLDKSNMKKADIVKVLRKQRNLSVTFAEVVALLKIIPDNDIGYDILQLLYGLEDVWRYKTKSLLVQIGIHHPITLQAVDRLIGQTTKLKFL